MIRFFRERWRSLLDTFLGSFVAAVVLGLEPILAAPSLGIAWSLFLALLVAALREAVLQVRLRFLREAPRA